MTSKPRHQAPSRRRRRDCFWRKIWGSNGDGRTIKKRNPRIRGDLMGFPNTVNVNFHPAEVVI